MHQHATIEVIRGQIRRLMADFGGRMPILVGEVKPFLSSIPTGLAFPPTEFLRRNELFCTRPNFIPFFGIKILPSFLSLSSTMNRLSNPPMGRLYWPIMSKPMVNMVSLDQ